MGQLPWQLNCARDCFETLDVEGGTFTLGEDAYRCTKAMQAYYELGLVNWVDFGIPLLVNQEGGIGSVCSHWADASVSIEGIAQELMTSTLRAGEARPLSTVTVGALEDIGYEVNYNAADAFPDGAYAQGRRRMQEGLRAPMVADHSIDLSMVKDVDIKPLIVTPH